MFIRLKLIRVIMAEIKLPQPVRLITGILASDEAALELAQKRIIELWGAVDVDSGTLPFGYSKYYREEAGDNILRSFLGFSAPFAREELIAKKLEANRLEDKLAAELGNGLSRPVNIDPGYLAPEKLVLASCKNFAHRIYLGQGVFAEVTLLYKAGRFVPLEWTFPDYASGDYYPFFYEVRKRLMSECER